MRVVHDLLSVPPSFGVLRGHNIKVGLIALRSIRVEATYFGAPALEYSTLLEVTEASSIHDHPSCTRPTRCIPYLLGVQGVKLG